MNLTTLFVAILLSVVVADVAHAHGIAGNRVFYPTLTIDDPAVADELSLPTVTTFHQNAAPDGSTQGFRLIDFGVEWDKRITENFGFAANWDYLVQDNDDGSSNKGLTNFLLTLKYQLYVNDAHEFMASVGITREFPSTGAKAVGASLNGSTTPKVYVGKGLGDLPIGYFRPLAVTGTYGYSFSDDRNVDPDQMNIGISVQYSLPYLQQHVVDIGLPGFFAKMTPLVELNMTKSPGQPTTGTIAPGILFTEKEWQFGIEALLPINRATNTDIGIIAQIHYFLDDLYPRSLGRPLFQ
ncbi:MAG TPA: hypothetical protein VMJ66_10580 [Geobacteraceae bacterium]|nr:hypothetical protein [Geobacteraceae bacterium]